MLTYPEIDPVAVAIGPLKVHWYGLMYVIGFAGAWVLGRYRAPRLGLSSQQVDDLIFYVAMGVVLGGRVGYVLFYNFTMFLSDPFMLFRVWEGGMSFHGGLLGVLLAVFIYGRRNGYRFLELTDFLAPFVPIGLCAGRIGNFINGELWGKITDVPWAVGFPPIAPVPRHPSQLYEAFLEGVVLFLVLMIFSRCTRPIGAVSGLFLIGYGCFRFIVEFWRLPDEHIGYLAFDWLTMGQVLSLPMIFLGIFLFVRAMRKSHRTAAA